MRMVLGAAPLMRAPMEFRKLAKSTTWGSLALLCMVVLPLAFTAVSTVLTVAPTLTMSRYTSAPRRPWVLACMAPFDLHSAPRAVMPFDGLVDGPGADGTAAGRNLGALEKAQKHRRQVIGRRMRLAYS